MNKRLDPPAEKTILLGEDTERNADIKTALEHEGIKRLRGRHHNAPVPSSMMPERGRLGNAMVALLSLALLLFSFIRMLAVTAGAYALTPHQLSASSLAGRPTKTPPARHSPTPTTVPSPSPPPTTIATVPTSVTPPAKATTPSATGKPGGSQRLTPVSTPSTSSTSSPPVQHPSRVQQKAGDAFLPLVIGTLSGIAAVVLLVAGGRWLLRQWLMPVRKVKLPPSGAAPWQRVRTTSLPGSMNSSGDSTQNYQRLMPASPPLETLFPPGQNSQPMATLSELNASKELLRNKQHLRGQSRSQLCFSLECKFDNYIWADC